jgi:hypothetical protein
MKRPSIITIVWMVFILVFAFWWTSAMEGPEPLQLARFKSLAQPLLAK